MPLTVVTTPDLESSVAPSPGTLKGISLEAVSAHLPCVMVFNWPEAALAVLLADGYSLRDGADMWKASVATMLELHHQHPEETALLAAPTFEHEEGVEALTWLRNRWPEVEVRVTCSAPAQWQLLAAKEWVARDQEFGCLVDALQAASASLPGNGYAPPVIDIEAVVAGERESAHRLSAVNELLQNQLQHLEELLEKYYLENRRLKERLQGKGFGEVVRARGVPLSHRLGSILIVVRQKGWLAIKRLARPFRRLTQERKEQLKMIELVASSEYFDADWYALKNPDVAKVFKNPAEHYFLHGGHEGRDPSARFSSRTYLLDNPDVAKAGVNPLVHYLQHGKAEGRAFPAP